MVRDLYRPDACLYSTKREDLAWGRYQSSFSDRAKWALLSTTDHSYHSTSFYSNILKCRELHWKRHSSCSLFFVLPFFFDFSFPELSSCPSTRNTDIKTERRSLRCYSHLSSLARSVDEVLWGLKALHRDLTLNVQKKGRYALHGSPTILPPAFQRAEHLCNVAVPNVSCVCPVTEASVCRWTLHLPFLVSEWEWKSVPSYSVKLLIGRHTILSQLHFSFLKMSNLPFYMMKFFLKIAKMELQVKRSPVRVLSTFLNVRMHSKKKNLIPFLIQCDFFFVNRFLLF